jgi:hypothetical protein
VLQAIKGIHPKFVVISEFSEGNSIPPLDVGMKKLLPQLVGDVGGIAKDIIWIESTPNFSDGGKLDPAACLALRDFRVNFRAGPAGGCFQTLGGATQAQAGLPAIVSSERLAASTTGITVFNPMPLFCQTMSTNGICPPIIENIGVYFDLYHISSTYALYLAPILGKEFPT